MIKAVADKIVVEFLRTGTTETGLILPDMVEDPQGFGKVISIGDEVENIKEGDILVFHMRAGMDLILNKRVQKCLKYEEVYGVLEDKELESRLKPLDFSGKSESENLVKPARGGVVIAP